MVELKTKLCVTTLCFCGGTIHPHHTTTTTTTTLLHHRRRHHHHALPPPQAPPPPQQQQQQDTSNKPGSGPYASKIARKYRRSRLKRVKRQEFKKLKDMVPALQEKPVVTKVEVIEEAIKYIDELHTALIERFRTRGLPSPLQDLPLQPGDIHGGNIRDLVRHLLAASSTSSSLPPTPPSRLENSRALPSFLHRVAKARRL